MYGKLFTSMFDGSLYGQWEAIITLQQMVILCDQHGVVDMTPQAISGKTSIPIDIIQRGIEQLAAPDPASRSKNCDGRRIVPIDRDRPWGWEIVNHRYYRDMGCAEDKRQRERDRYKKQRGNKGLHDSAEVCQCLPDSADSAYTNTDTDTDTDTEEEKERILPDARSRLMRRFDEFWEAYDNKKSKGQAEKTWKKLKPNDQLCDTIIEGARQTKKLADRGVIRFRQHPSTWLNAKGWEDEHSPEPVRVLAKRTPNQEMLERMDARQGGVIDI